ncbi:MAG TPA: O-antigen ligase family protein [Thermoanaerobaculia bacterium]|jgi:O-antigen ligase
MIRKSRSASSESAIFFALAAGLLLTATIVSGGAERFRLAKEVVFRGEAIVLVALFAFWATSANRTWKFTWRKEYLLALAIVAWAAITTLTSTNRVLSIDPLITVVAAAIIFFASSLAARPRLLDVVMAACGINAVAVILQEAKLWVPFPPAPGQGTHYSSVGLLGNANDVGTYLAAPAVVAVAVAVTSAGKRRWIYAAIALLLAGGIIASATRTAVVAMVAGLVVFGLVHSRRAAVIVLAALVIFAFVVLSPATTLGREMRDLGHAAVNRDLQTLFSERLVPFLTAIDMTRDHPLIGVGPGCFKYHYMPYRVALFGRYPDAWTKGYPMNWGEVHNDHLQVAAETGLPGYALFLAAIALCAGRKKSAFRWPLAAVIFVLTLAQFPLELAAPRLVLLTLGALALDESSVLGPRSSVVVRDRGLRTEDRGLATVIRVAAIAFAAFAGYFLCVLPYRANIALATITQRTLNAQNVDPISAAPVARANLHDLAAISTPEKLNPTWYLLYGTNCEILGSKAEAAGIYSRALEIDQRPEIYFNRAMVRLQLGRIDDAVNDLATAARFNPFVLYELSGDLRDRVEKASRVR